MPKYKRLTPLPDNISALIKTINAKGEVEYVDAIDSGHTVFFASIEECNDEKLGAYVVNTYGEADTEGAYQDVRYVPTKICHQCHIRMIPHGDKNGLIYRCEGCNTEKKTEFDL